MTDDIDILVPIPWRGRALELAEILRQLGFSEHFKANGTTSYLRPGLRVEFLSPKKRMRRSKTTSLGVNPQELAFMQMLLDEPLTIKIMAGVNVRVPSPSRFMIHKLIIAQRRSGADKKQKDLIQALSVARFVLGHAEQRKELAEAWKSMIPAWRKKALASALNARAEFPLEEGVIDGLQEFLAKVAKTTR